MPVYEYQREDGTRFEMIQKITERAITVDEVTGQKCVRLIVGSTPLHFKGDGFYETDYARKK